MTAEGRYSVLLLEAGGEAGSCPSPGPAGSVWHGARTRSCDRPMIRSLLPVHGAPQDYEEWAAAGNTGWGWHDVLPGLRMLEDGGDRRDSGATPGACGCAERDALIDAFVAATRQAGLPYNDDSAAAFTEGVARVPLNRPQGSQGSSVAAMLASARRRPNLQLRLHAYAQAIVFAGHRAVAVRYRHHGRDLFAHVGHEVILCAGTIASPQLLQRSGVGPAAYLRDLGIEVIADLPATGGHLRDHFLVGVTHRLHRAPRGGMLRRVWRRICALPRAAAGRHGPPPLSAARVNAFLHDDPATLRPDLQLYFLPVAVEPGSGELASWPGLTCAVCQLRPASHGSVLITSADGRTPPHIRFRHLDAPVDQHIVLAGVRRARDLLARPAIAGLQGEELGPGAAVTDDATLLAYVREAGMPLRHPVGTCRIGSDRAGVVDATLRVHGLVGLRVVDASVMPALISGDPHLSVRMIAGRAAGWILQDAAAATAPRRRPEPVWLADPPAAP
ncbi:GMC family oxidoreductase [Rhodovastum atsumiense]|uniref:GMC family oxidoreductase n=1 Tax=Rhodovastum atsumiense TaxID=504468 RepID=UPI0038CFE7BF